MLSLPYRGFVILPCAGLGKRMGKSLPKFLLDLGGISILGLTLKHLHECEDVSQVILVLNQEILEEFSTRYLPELPHKKISLLVEGGKERQDSIWHGLLALKGKEGDFRIIQPHGGAKPLLARDDDLVAVHDAVRPFASPKDFSEVFKKAHSHGAAIIATKVQDTIKEKKAGNLLFTPNRENLFQAQTPQTFRLGLLTQAYQNAYENNLLGTDDASLVEALGTPIHLVLGSPWNLKITRPEDLLLAKTIWQKKFAKEN